MVDAHATGAGGVHPRDPNPSPNPTPNPNPNPNQVTRTREAIRKRGLLLHDAFLKFDYSRTGMLSLDEVYGAFEWLKIPVTPEEVLFFVRSVSRRGQRHLQP